MSVWLGLATVGLGSSFLTGTSGTIQMATVVAMEEEEEEEVGVVKVSNCA